MKPKNDDFLRSWYFDVRIIEIAVTSELQNPFIHQQKCSQSISSIWILWQLLHACINIMMTMMIKSFLNIETERREPRTRASPSVRKRDFGGGEIEEWNWIFINWDPKTRGRLLYKASNEAVNPRGSSHALICQSVPPSSACHSTQRRTEFW